MVDRQPEAVPGVAVIDKVAVAVAIAPPCLITPRHADADRGAAIAQHEAAAGWNPHFGRLSQPCPRAWSGVCRRARCRPCGGARNGFATCEDFRGRQVPATIDHQPQGVARSLRPAQNGCMCRALGCRAEPVSIFFFP